jgi:hypothetical protein
MLLNFSSCKTWLDNSEQIFLRKKINVPHAVTAEYFMSVHAATEAAFRQVQFIGLRMQGVTYRNAQDWLFHNDSTPSNDKRTGSFQNNFNLMFGKSIGSWDSLLKTNGRLRCLWDLWIGYTKHIRNHIAHGVRGYNGDDLERALAIDFALLSELKNALSPYIGGGLYAGLASLSPRLPRGNSQKSVPQLLGIKKSKTPRPPITISEVNRKLGEVFVLPIEIA